MLDHSRNHCQLGVISKIQISQVLSSITNISMVIWHLIIIWTLLKQHHQSQKNSLGTIATDNHAQNDRMGAFEPEIIVIDYAITLRYLYETSILDGKYLFAETKKSQLHFKNTLQGIFKVFKVFKKKLLQIYSICTFAYAFAFKFKYIVAHAHPHA